MKRILCPTDFSSTAKNAVTYAAAIAQEINATLTLIHTHLLFRSAVPGTSNSRLDDLLRNECSEIEETFKIECNAETVESGGTLIKRIANAATGFDLIIMGSDGESGTYQKIFGSSTFRLIKRTKIPVIIVPAQTAYSKIKRIAYAFDRWRNAIVPMDKIVDISRDLNCEITMVQVMEGYDPDAENELRAAAEIMMDQYSDDVKLSFKTIYSQSISHALHDFMLKEDYEALALCFRGGLGDQLHSTVIRESTSKLWFPILVVHP